MARSRMFAAGMRPPKGTKVSLANIVTEASQKTPLGTGGLGQAADAIKKRRAAIRKAAQ